MKKLVIFLILAMVFTVSCSSSKKTETDDDTDILPDEDAVDVDENEDEDEDTDEEEESSLPDEDIPLEEAVCKPNPCKKMEHSNGKCEFDGDRSFICHCEEGYFWEDGACLSPCDPDPCKNVEHSIGCYVKSRYEFLCSCGEEYSWNGEKCWNPCEDDNPCPAHSTCYFRNMADIPYDCFCDDNYFMWGEKCMTPCDPNPCTGLPNSTGECKASSRSEYSCVCDNNYVFSQEKGCVGPCNPNPCSGKENSTGICYTIDEYNYSCGCAEGLYWLWLSSVCETVPECSASNRKLCKDSGSGLMWSERFADESTADDYGIDAKLVGYSQAENYCQNLKEGGFTDWRLPTIDELRTIVVNCPGLESGGACKISEVSNCLSEACYSQTDCVCQGENEYSVFSKFGYEDENGVYWSSSTGIKNGEKFRWLIMTTGYALPGISDLDESNLATVRCVRK